MTDPYLIRVDNRPLKELQIQDVMAPRYWTDDVMIFFLPPNPVLMKMAEEATPYVRVPEKDRGRYKCWSTGTKKETEDNADGAILHGAAEMTAITDPMRNLLPVDVHARFKKLAPKTKGTLIITTVEDFNKKK